jgi:hypothetical protein
MEAFCRELTGTPDPARACLSYVDANSYRKHAEHVTTTPHGQVAVHISEAGSAFVSRVGEQAA